MSLDLEPRDGDFVRYIELLMERQSPPESLRQGPPPETGVRPRATVRTRQDAPTSGAQGSSRGPQPDPNNAGAVLRQTFFSSNGALFIVVALLVGAIRFAHSMIPVLAVLLAIWLGTRSKRNSPGVSTQIAERGAADESATRRANQAGAIGSPPPPRTAVGARRDESRTIRS